MLVFKAQKQDDKEERFKWKPIYLISGIRQYGQFLTLPTHVSIIQFWGQLQRSSETWAAFSGWQSNKRLQSSHDLLLHPYSWVWCWVLIDPVEQCCPPPFLNMQCFWLLRMLFFCLDNFPPACPQPPTSNRPLTLSTAMGRTQFQ